MGLADAEDAREVSMLRTRRFGSLLVAAATLLVTPLGLPRTALAHGRGRVYVGVGLGFGGYYGWAPYWGFGPYWGWGWGWGPGPYYYGAAERGIGAAMASGMGALDVDVKPNRAEVWVDG